MAISNPNSAISFGPKLQIQALQTVVPTKPTEPRESFTILVPQNLSSTTILQRRFHILLCYNKACDDDSGWLVAGRMKESLGRALQEHPILAGRLRWREEDGADLQIVSNDSGVRLMEGRADMKLDHFVEAEEKREADGELVYWEDVVELNPHFSPLFYVQITNFSCGGYSIGISCSLLLADPFTITNFLKKWFKIHNSIVSKTDVPQIPTFYLPNLGKPGASLSLLMGSNTATNAAHTVILTIPSKISNLDSKNLAASCINEAEHETGAKMASNLSLLIHKVPSEDGKLEICSRQGILESPLSGDMSGVTLTCARTWDELGLDTIFINEGKNPVYVSCWINSVVDEGSVMIIPSSDDANTSGTKIVVTFN